MGVSERKEDLKNVKLLTSESAGKKPYYSKKHGKDITEYKVFLQSVDDEKAFHSGVMGDYPPIPEVGSTIDKLLVFADNYNGHITTKFVIPDQQSSGDSGGGNAAQGGKSSWTGGRQEDVELKLVSFGFSYAKDLFAATPEASIKGLVDTANTLIDEMYTSYKRLKA